MVVYFETKVHTSHTGLWTLKKRHLYHVRYSVEMYYILSSHPNITLYIRNRRNKREKKFDTETLDFLQFFLIILINYEKYE